MKNRFHSLLATVVALCMLVVNFSASAAENTFVQPRLTAVVSIESNLTITTLGRADCYSKTVLEAGYSGDFTMELQRSTNQVLWDTVKTWSTSGSGTLELDKSYYVSSDYYYRVLATVDTYNAAGTFIETVSQNSQICSH